MSACTEACRAVVDCVTCGKRKAPVGRSVPLACAGGYCDFECPGYRSEPKPPHLWPSERLPGEPEPAEDVPDLTPIKMPEPGRTPLGDAVRESKAVVDELDRRRWG